MGSTALDLLGNQAGYLIPPGLWTCSGKSLAALNTPGLPEGLASMKLLGRGADQNESLRWEGRSAEGKGKRGHVPGCKSWGHSQNKLINLKNSFRIV